MKLKRLHVLLAILAMGACVLVFRDALERPLVDVVLMLRGKKTIGDRLEEFGAAARARLAPDFQRLGVAYPPGGVVLVGLKQERLLEVWVNDESRPMLLKTYPIRAASGTLGPKLKEYDLQVPEGCYEIESLNPNSSFHVALRVNYPNSFDKTKGRLDNRDSLGSDIMIHGKSASIGCLAMGDEVAEELFTLAADTGLNRISLILSPVDFRVRQLPPDIPGLPEWAPELYQLINNELAKLRG